jgi:hypothetical protein
MEFKMKKLLLIDYENIKNFDVFNFLNKKLPMSSIDQSIDTLIKKGIIHEVSGKITYNFMF